MRMPTAASRGKRNDFELGFCSFFLPRLKFFKEEVGESGTRTSCREQRMEKLRTK
jgi:hypothetical protein